MSNRGIGRARMFMGGLLLLAAAISWFVGFTMSPHAAATGEGTNQVRSSVVLFLRNSAIGNLVLCALAGWLLYPPRRPRWPARDYALLAILAIIVLTSLYQLMWLRNVAS